MVERGRIKMGGMGIGSDRGPGREIVAYSPIHMFKIMEKVDVFSIFQMRTINTFPLNLPNTNVNE